MKLIVKFNDGKTVTMNNWDKWKKDYGDHNDIIGLVEHYKEINKELTFDNPETGLKIKRNAEDVDSIEIVFD